MKHRVNSCLHDGMFFLQTKPCSRRISGHRWVMWPGKKVGRLWKWLTSDSGDFSLGWRRAQIISWSILLEASSDLRMFFFFFLWDWNDHFKYLTASFYILICYLYSRKTCIPKTHHHSSSIEAHPTPISLDFQTSTALACSGLWPKCGSSLVDHHVQLWAATLFSESWCSALASDSVLPCLS